MSGQLKEFTLKAVVCGLVFGVLFGAANAYLGLKAGLTVATSIPIAVLSVAVFRLISRQGGNILEANMAQTIGSASSSLASGTIFTIPALFMWGVVPTVTQVAILAFLGGLLGILAMIPLRRLLIVQSHHELPYPEGVACAEVLITTQEGRGGGKWIFIGLGLGIAIKILISAMHLLPEEVSTKLSFLPNASLAIKIAPALLAVGFIIGFRTSSVMVAGGLITSLMLYPLITKIYAAGKGEILSSSAVKSQFVIYLGAGAIAAAGILTVIKSTPTLFRTLNSLLQKFSSSLHRKENAVSDRTDKDLPSSFLFGGLLFLFLVLTFVPGIFAGELTQSGRLIAALSVFVFGFIFIPVSSRLVGMIGVSANPTSAMVFITLAGTAILFSNLNLGGALAKATVLTVGTIVCVAASKAGDISQDLKTGFLVKGTPALQQFGQLIAASVACWAIAAVVVTIGNGPEGFGENGMPAPQARLMKTIIEAVMGESLPWDLLGMGGVLSAVAALAGLPALPFALGIYLPLSTMATIFVGGLVRQWIDVKSNYNSRNSDAGILCASGFVAGEGLAGVLIAGWAFLQNQGRYETPAPTILESLLSLAVLLVAAVVLFRSSRTKQTSSE